MQPLLLYAVSVNRGFEYPTSTASRRPIYAFARPCQANCFTRRLVSRQPLVCFPFSPLHGHVLDILCLCETCFVWWTCYVWTCWCSMNILWLMWYICLILCLWCQICVMYIVCDLFVNTEKNKNKKIIYIAFAWCFIGKHQANLGTFSSSVPSFAGCLL